MKISVEKYSEVLFREFYAMYKVERQRQYRQGQLWRGGELITLLVIQDIRVDISPHTIKRFLYGSEYQAPANTGEIDNQMEDLRKITRKILGLENEMVNFGWIAKRITSIGQNDILVVRGPGWSRRRFISTLLTWRVKNGGNYLDICCVQLQEMM